MEHEIQRYRHWYRKLIRLYSKPYYERFGEGMEQAFGDLLKERAAEGKGLFTRALWMFIETSGGIIKENIRRNTMHTKNIIRIAIATVAILLIPLIAMQFSNEVNWSAFDFVFAGVLLFGTGLAYELVARKAGTTAYRAAVSMALAATFLLIWINGAVGIIGSEDNPANILYGVVLLVGLVGTIAAGLKPRGMSYTLFAVALVQALVPVVALIVWRPQADSAEAVMGILGVFILNTFFVALYAGSALLFHRAK